MSALNPVGSYNSSPRGFSSMDTNTDGCIDGHYSFHTVQIVSKSSKDASHFGSPDEADSLSMSDSGRQRKTDVETSSEHSKEHSKRSLCTVRVRSWGVERATHSDSPDEADSLSSNRVEKYVEIDIECEESRCENPSPRDANSRLSRVQGSHAEDSSDRKMASTEAEFDQNASLISSANDSLDDRSTSTETVDNLTNSAHSQPNGCQLLPKQIPVQNFLQASYKKPRRVILPPRVSQHDLEHNPSETSGANGSGIRRRAPSLRNLRAPKKAEENKLYRWRHRILLIGTALSLLFGHFPFNS